MLSIQIFIKCGDKFLCKIRAVTFFRIYVYVLLFPLVRTINHDYARYEVMCKTHFATFRIACSCTMRMPTNA